MTTTDLAFPDTTWARTFGVTTKPERAWAQGLVSALQKVDRALLPPAADHPLAMLIARGPASFGKLLDLVEKGAPQESLDAIDALSHVLLEEKAPPDVVLRLRRALQRETDKDRAAYLVKTLAIGRDEGLLREELVRLGDDDPGLVASAARLLGFGRYRAAVPVLMQLVSPTRLFESRAVIWALGEIGDRRALPALRTALAHGFRVVDALIAVGKLGELASLPLLTPACLQGLPDQRDAAYRAMAMILDRHRSELVPALAQQLVGLIEGQLMDPALTLSGSTRFHMVLCLARLSRKLDPARVQRFLGLTLDEAGHVTTLWKPAAPKAAKAAAPSPKKLAGKSKAAEAAGKAGAPIKSKK